MLMQRYLDDLAKEVCDGFLNGSPAGVEVTQGLYSYEKSWKGALRWLRRSVERGAV